MKIQKRKAEITLKTYIKQNSTLRKDNKIWGTENIKLFVSKINIIIKTNVVTENLLNSKP